MAKRIVLNIRGVNYETYEETLVRFPNTLLGNSALRKLHWDAKRGAYYFDRNHYLFDAILFFYQSGGIIAKPDCIDDGEFQEELRFFGIINDKPAAVEMNNNTFEVMSFLRQLTDYQSASSWSRSFALFSTITIILSTITFCLETVFTDLHDDGNNSKKTKFRIMMKSSSDSNNYFFICETIYMAWFSLEYLLRVLSHPARVNYIISIQGLVDLLAIVPYFVILSKAFDKYDVAKRVIKLVQILRILKISRFSKSLQLLGKSLYYCRGQISLLLMFFFINCFACGSVLYSVEKSFDPLSNTSLMDTIWFCVVSMTTVGYGDIVPQTSLGKLMAAITILVGIVILFHIFIPVYLSYFALLYEISVLNTLETNKDDGHPERQEEDEYKKHRRKSISSSVRKSIASVGNVSSVCINETVSRKQSASITEETVMRRFRYDYLRKLSSVESALSTSQKSIEVSETSPFHFNKISSDKLSVRTHADAEETTSDLGSHSETTKGSSESIKQTTIKARKKVVYEQPIFFENGYESLCVKRKVRSSSFSHASYLEDNGKQRKHSLSDRMNCH